MLVQIILQTIRSTKKITLSHTKTHPLTGQERLWWSFLGFLTNPNSPVRHLTHGFEHWSLSFHLNFNLWMTWHQIFFFILSIYSLLQYRRVTEEIWGGGADMDSLDTDPKDGEGGGLRERRGWITALGGGHCSLGASTALLCTEWGDLAGLGDSGVALLTPPEISYC